MSYFAEGSTELMKIFISWSGDKSKEVAKVLKQWIPCVIQSVEPYFSSDDIDKGARWSSDISKELQDASFGILCVTQDNINSSWLNFEAGALSKSIDQSKVCPFLVDLRPSDIQNSPILQFQMTSATKEDILKLFESINSNLGDAKLTEERLSTSFNAFWPQIENALNSISGNDSPSPSETKEERDQGLLEEILELVRYQYKLLKSPEDLLPPEYLVTAFRNVERSYPKGYFFEVEDIARRIKVAASRFDDVCPFMNDQDMETPLCKSLIADIMDASERLLMITKRANRMIKF